jgi:hypothetical protein
MAVKKLIEAGYKAGKKKLKSMLKGSKKTTPKKTTPKVTPKKTAPKKSTVKPATIDFKKAKRTLVGTGVAGGTAGYMAGKSGNKKVETKKPAPKKTVNTPKKEQTYYKSNPNKSNAPRPDYTPKKTETKKEEKFDRMAAARNQQRMAQKSMGFKKGGAVKRDGCAMRGKTRGKLI